MNAQIIKKIKKITNKTTGEAIVIEDALYQYTPKIKKVIFHDPATIIYWNDNTKTIVKCEEGDTFSEEAGLALCISKKMLGNKEFHKTFEKFVDWSSQKKKR